MGHSWPRILTSLWLAIQCDPFIYCIVLCCMLTDCTCMVCKHMLLFPIGTPHWGLCCPAHHPTCLPHSHLCKTLSHLCTHMLPDMLVMQPPARPWCQPFSAPCGSAHVHKDRNARRAHHLVTTHNMCAPLPSPLMGQGQVSFRLSSNVQPCCGLYVNNGLWKCQKNQPQQVGMSRSACPLPLACGGAS